MKVLFEHERFGALGGAEVNILATAEALAECGHEVALLHGSGKGNHEEAWMETFRARFTYAESNGGCDLTSVVDEFQPDVVFLHRWVLPVLLWVRS